MTLFTPVIDVAHTPYCGPTAISALTGQPLSRIEAMIRRKRRGGYRDRNGRRLPIKGTYPSEVVRVLKLLGCKVQPVKVFEGSFARFVEDTRHIGACLVEVTGHFIATHNGVMIDNNLREPTPIETYHRGGRRVRRAWRVTTPTEPPAIETPAEAMAAKTERAPKPKRDIKQVRAERLAAHVKAWESKERRAKNALKRLRPKLARYVKAGVI